MMLRYLGALELDSVEVQVQLGDKKDIKDLIPKKVKQWHNWLKYNAVALNGFASNN